MDKRSWPWKKKSSEKTDANFGDKDKTKNVQISAESYAYLIEMEARVKILNQKLSSAQSDITNKDNLVKQHAKVAEDAIAGWEKAEAETLALKDQLESVTLLKLTAEDRVSHLDDALKECMKEIRIVKEESEQQLHDTIFAKTKQWEAIESELDAKIADLEQELLASSAENAALSRFLQERSNMLIRINNEKSQAESEIEVLKSDIQSCEKEINSLKYEVHVVTKELEIRNEEKNMSMRLAETANKQHLEDVKKISRLEAECQRLRGLVKKKLPGPAALAQMKLEVENLGRRSPAKHSSSYLALPPNFSLEEMQHCHKENEYLTAQLLAAEQETKMLKEALSKRNNELHATRSICAKTASKLRSIETQVFVMNKLKDTTKSNVEISFEGSLGQHRSNPSLTSMSEDGIDEEGSCSESCSTPLKSENSIEKFNKAGKSKNMELMDDFLEMERLACLPTEINGTVNQSGGKPATDGNNSALSKLKSRVISLFGAGISEMDAGKILEDIVRIVHDELPQHSPSFTNDEAPSENTLCELENSPKGIVKHAIDKELKNAISQIHDIIVPLCKEAVEIQGRSLDDCVLQEKVMEFSSSMNKVLCDEINLDNFIFALSHMLSETMDVRSDMLSNKEGEAEANGNDCIDKLTLLETQHEPAKPKAISPEVNRSQNLYLEEYEQMKIEKDRMEQQLAELKSQLAACQKSNSLADTQLKCMAQSYESLESRAHELGTEINLEEYEQMKIEKDRMEQQLAELKSQLAACQKSNSLADTQLKCMAQSYESLESRAHELGTEINLLRSKIEALDIELQEERRSHEDDLAKYVDLQGKYERDTRCSLCLLHKDGDVDKAKQDREIAAAAEKLAECQETMLLLGKQLKAMQPAPTSSTSYSTDKPQMNGYSLQSMLDTNHQDQISTDNDDAASVILRTGEDSFPFDEYNSHFTPFDFESIPNSKQESSSKCKKNRSGSTSASSLSSMLNETHSRGFSRFFSRGK